MTTMTTTANTSCTVPRDGPVAVRRAPLAALGAWLRGRTDRSARYLAVADVPPALRRDVGLDGGVPLARFENGGRTFVVGNCPDPTLSGWHW